jgi:hypothetical protein
MVLLFRRVQMEVASRTLRPPRRARLVGTSYQGLAWCARTTTLRLTSAPTSPKHPREPSRCHISQPPLSTASASSDKPKSDSSKLRLHSMVTL